MPVTPLQRRLAQHYLEQLRAAAFAVRRGRSSLAYGLEIFDREWPHIQRWQAWAAMPDEDSSEKAYFCQEFALAGADVLALRLPPAERLDWWQAALRAAQKRQDRQAESAILPSLAMIYSSIGDLEQAEVYTRQSLRLAQTMRDGLGIGRAFYQLGTIAEDSGHTAEASDYYQRSLKWLKGKSGNRYAGLSLLGLGSIAVYSGEHQKGYDYFLQYLAYTERYGTEVDRCIALQAVSEALNQLHQYREAEQYLQRCLHLCRTLNYQWALGSTLITLGYCALEQGNLTDAERYLEEGVQVSRAYSSRRDVVYGLGTLGYLRMKQGELSAALAHYQEGLATAREAGLPRYCSQILRRMAHLHVEQGDAREALPEVREALELARVLDLQPEKVKAICTAVMLAHHLGWLEQATLWMGCVAQEHEAEHELLNQASVHLMTSLGSGRFQQLLQCGQASAINAVLDEALHAIDDALAVSS